MASKARKKNAQGQIASEFCDPQACGKDGQAITLLPTTPEPSPPLVLAEGEGLWGNLMLTRCPAPGVEKGRAHFPGGDMGRDPSPPLSRGLSLGKKDTNKEMKQTSPLDPGALSLQKAFFLLIFLEAKEGISKHVCFPLAKFYDLASTIHSGDKCFNRITLRPLIDLPKQRKLNTR